MKQLNLIITNYKSSDTSMKIELIKEKKKEKSINSINNVQQKNVSKLKTHKYKEKLNNITIDEYLVRLLTPFINKDYKSIKELHDHIRIFIHNFINHHYDLLFQNNLKNQITDCPINKIIYEYLFINKRKSISLMENYIESYFSIDINNKSNVCNINKNHTYLDEYEKDLSNYDNKNDNGIIYKNERNNFYDFCTKKENQNCYNYKNTINRKKIKNDHGSAIDKIQNKKINNLLILNNLEFCLND